MGAEGNRAQRRGVPPGMRASSLVLTLVAAAVTGVGCGTTCTAMGCSDAVTVDVGAVAPGG